MTLQQLIYFREVANTLNFTKASRNLNVTQSALSYSILSLERELELPLFVRRCGKKIDLTGYGRTLIPMAEKAISNIQDIETTMRQIRDPHAGIVNIAFSYVNGWRFMSSMLHAFREEAPESTISIRLNINHARHNFEEDVLQGISDIAFSCLDKMEGLMTVPFAQQQLYAALPPHHPLAMEATAREISSLTAEQLRDEPLIGYHRGRNLDRWIGEMFSKADMKANVVDYTDDWSSQIMKVSVGEGIAILPRVPVEPGSIVFVPLSGNMSVRPVYMMWADNRSLSAAVEFARDFFLDYRHEIDVI